MERSCALNSLNKMAASDFGPVTVIICERALFFCVHSDFFMGCNKQIVNTALNQSLNSAVM